jgi:hypothetical protein
MISGRCASCSASTSTLVESASPNVNDRELMLVLGAVGVVLGLLVIAGKS